MSKPIPARPPTTPTALQIVSARVASGSSDQVRSTTIVFTEAVTPSATSTTTT